MSGPASTSGPSKQSSSRLSVVPSQSLSMRSLQVGVERVQRRVRVVAVVAAAVGRDGSVPVHVHVVRLAVAVVVLAVTAHLDPVGVERGVGVIAVARALVEAVPVVVHGVDGRVLVVAVPVTRREPVLVDVVAVQRLVVVVAVEVLGGAGRIGGVRRAVHRGEAAHVHPAVVVRVGGEVRARAALVDPVVADLGGVEVDVGVGVVAVEATGRAAVTVGVLGQGRGRREQEGQGEDRESEAQKGHARTPKRATGAAPGRAPSERGRRPEASCRSAPFRLSRERT